MEKYEKPVMEVVEIREEIHLISGCNCSVLSYTGNCSDSCGFDAN